MKRIDLDGRADHLLRQPSEESLSSVNSFSFVNMCKWFSFFLTTGLQCYDEGVERERKQ